jgi:hypothetical protein
MQFLESPNPAHSSAAMTLTQLPGLPDHRVRTCKRACRGVVTERPLVVMASVREPNIFGSSERPCPCLLTSGWTARADALRDLLPLVDLVQRSLQAVRCAAIGPSVPVYRVLRRNA